ncbi:MAG: DUF2249 domain-containing protein [Deltaproteobacteria bacterium]|nr:DUF2249 domain-containing protein [Deltaproteobacteria bacterium]
MIILKEETPLVKLWEEDNTSHLDVRELLEAGGEPYNCIMSCVNQLKDGDTMVLHALFEPIPLLLVLDQMGLDAQPEKVDEEHWKVRITPR